MALHSRDLQFRDHWAARSLSSSGGSQTHCLHCRAILSSWVELSDLGLENPCTSDSWFIAGEKREEKKKKQLAQVAASEKGAQVLKPTDPQSYKVTP